MQRTIYLVLTETGSLLSRAIKLYTQDQFNHVSLAFDPDLKEMYSFGRKKENNPWIGGFIHENPTSKLLRTANCAIYAYTVSAEQYALLKYELEFFKCNRHRFRYNFIGLLCVACRIRWKRQDAYFCSQFIALLFSKANINTNLCPYFIKPKEFEQLQGLQLIYQGKLTHYIFHKHTISPKLLEYTA